MKASTSAPRSVSTAAYDWSSTAPLLPQTPDCWPVASWMMRFIFILVGILGMWIVGAVNETAGAILPLPLSLGLVRLGTSAYA